MLCNYSRYLGSQSRVLSILLKPRLLGSAGPAGLKSVPVEHTEFDRIEDLGSGVSRRLRAMRHSPLAIKLAAFGELAFIQFSEGST